MSDPHAPIDPKPDPFDSPDTPEDDEPDTVATPEGDNGTAPGQPLKPAPEGLQTPLGGDTHGETQAYKQDRK
jgi:hypothetical protein